jgi:hypothetical protein
VAGLLTRETAAMDKLAARGTDLLVAQIARMSPEERRAYAQALLADRGRGDHHR